MKIKIKINELKHLNNIVDIIFSFKVNKKEYKAKTNIDFSDIYKFGGKSNSVTFDLVFISIVIYSIDRLISRKYSNDGWSRNLDVVIPIYNIEKFKLLEKDFDKCISFLTGDIWNIKFKKNKKEIIKDTVVKQAELFNYDAVSLFSGGMDSLIGILDFLNNHKKKKILLVSHYGYPRLVYNDQKRLYNKLKKEYSERIKWLKCRVDLTKITKEIEYDENFRSRSLLFISLGVYVANIIKSSTKLLISENGSISLNFPLTKSRYSSCSTRTTHPTYLSMLKELLLKIGINNPIINSYTFMTKGEMLSQYANNKDLLDIIKISNSCAKRGHQSSWTNRGREHCGFCLPCFYRRAAFNSIGEDDSDSYGIDVFNKNEFDLNKNSLKNKDFKALLYFLKAKPDFKQIANELIINGIDEIDKIDNYVDVIIKTRKELKEWIKTKASNEIKKMVGI